MVRLPFCVHHSDDPNSIRLSCVDDRIWKGSAKRPSERAVKKSEEFRLFANQCDRSLNLIVEPNGDRCINIAMVFDCLDKLGFGLGMERMANQRDRIFRIFAATSSPGTSRTFPDCNSSSRRSAVDFHADSTAG